MNLVIFSLPVLLVVGQYVFSELHPGGLAPSRVRRCKGRCR